MILALDPSSVRVGYAVMPSGDIIFEAGWLSPEHPKATAVSRSISMMCDLRELLQGGTTSVGGCAYNPDTKTWDTPPIDRVVIEVPDNKIHGRLGRASGLPMYGVAVGLMLAECLRWNVPVHAITPAQWTGRVPKVRRQIVLASQFSDYACAMQDDGGSDMADAICLGQWFFLQTDTTKDCSEVG